MPDVLSDDDLNVLAAEYVLGTLDYEERKGASALLEVDPAFRGVVGIWEKRFGDLHLMVESVPPDSMLWERIRPKLTGIEQIPPAIPPEPAPREPSVALPTEPAGALPTVTDTMPADSEAAPAAPTEGASAASTETASPAQTELTLAELEALARPAAAAARTPEMPATSAEEPASLAPARESEERQDKEQTAPGFVPPPPMLRRPAAPAAQRSGHGWMAASVLMGLAALALAALIAAWRFFPDQLPEPLQVYSVLNMPAPAPVAAEPPPPPRPAPPPPFDE